MQSYWRLHKYPLLFALGSALFYISFGYDLQRTDFTKLLTLYAALFFLYFKIMQFEKWNFNFLLAVGIVFRLVFLFAEPNLSQDHFRFIWDGELIKNGLNPYAYSPDEIMGAGEVRLANMEVLHGGMSELNARNYSNYPPVNQLFFAISSFLGAGSIMGSLVTMRRMIILGALGVLHSGRKLLMNMSQDHHKAFWYFLNPLVIIELSGNLHFEGLMLFFFVWAFYLISKSQWAWAAPVSALSIMVKLVPLMLLPMLMKFLGAKKSLGFYFLVGLACLLLMLPLYSADFLAHYSKTLGLWFSNFEFNAGLYKLVKGLATTYFDARPWELIKTYGATLIKVMVVLCLLIALVRKNNSLPSVITSMVLTLATYYFLSSTVHPWYIVFLLGMAIFTEYRFPLVWSFTVILSYQAYSHPEIKENLWLAAIEYLIVFGFFIYELMGRESKKLYFHKK